MQYSKLYILKYIKKLFQREVDNKELIYYHVRVFWPDPKGFFVLGIDSKNNKVLYFSEFDVNEPVATFDFNNPKQKFPLVLDFHIATIIATITQIRKAISNNNFPDRMSHANCGVYIAMEKIDV